MPTLDRVPWSLLGPEFIKVWGSPRGKIQPEHLEILGPTGSGKSMFKRDVLLERARRRGTNIVSIVTKEADQTASSIGWPIVDSWREVRNHEQCVFWPRTKKLGKERKEYQALKIEDLLNHLWTPDANTVVDFDEWQYVEGLNRDMKDLLNMYLREGRSHGLTVVMGKQRPQGTQRDMHSESDWKAAFKMNDRNDNERLAELFGNKRDWVPVIESLDREKYEFLIQHKLTGASYISWVDRPVQAAKKK
jgi:nucleoside-triphosphatase THEP1